MSELKLAMLAGARAIENNKRYQETTFVNNVHGENPEKISYYEAAKLLREEAGRAQPDNEPLTLDQLKQMDGEPVFVSMRNTMSSGEWYIVDVEEMELKNPWDRITLEGWEDGDYFKAYHRPPEK